MTTISRGPVVLDVAGTTLTADDRRRLLPPLVGGVIKREEESFLATIDGGLERIDAAGLDGGIEERLGYLAAGQRERGLERIDDGPLDRIERRRGILPHGSGLPDRRPEHEPCPCPVRRAWCVAPGHP